MRKAINRYGTVPKGTRIGAYLDSLHQDPLTGAGEAPADFVVCDDSGIGLQVKRRSPLDTATNKVKSIKHTIGPSIMAGKDQ